MKTVTNSILSLLMALSVSVATVGCAFLGDDACVGKCASANPDEDVERDIELGRLAVYTTDDDFIGYALDYYFDYIKIYIPAYDMYVTMHPQNGQYLRYPISQYEEIYFDQRDCAGNAVLVNFGGKVGATYIVAKNERTYQIHSTTYYSYSNPFKSLSRLVANRAAADSCNNASYSVQTYAANLVEDDELPELSAYAPFKLFASGNTTTTSAKKKKKK